VLPARGAAPWGGERVPALDEIVPRREGDVPAEVGAADRDPRTAEEIHQPRVRVPVGVARTHADQDRAGCHRGEELATRVTGAVVGHLEHLRPQVRSAREQLRLRLQLDVAGEQDPSGRCGRPQHDGGVVHRRAVLAVDLLRPGRGEDLEREVRPVQPPPRRQLDQSCPRRTGLCGDPADRGLGIVGGAQRDPAGGTPAEGPGQSADVVRVQVAEHDQGHRVDPEPAQAAVDRAVGGPDVHEHRPTGDAGGQDEGVPLADVAGDGHPARGRPPGPHDPGGQQHQREPDDDGQDNQPGPAMAERDHQSEQHRDEETGPEQSGRPRHDPTRHRGGSVGHDHQPPDGGPGQPRTPRCQGGAPG